MSYGYGYPPAQQDPYHPGYGYGYGPPARSSAPVSVHVVAILQYLGGLLGLIGAVLVVAVAMVGTGVIDDASVPADLRDALVGGGIVIAAVIAAFSLFAIYLGRGLQRGRQWARVLLLLLSALNLVGVLYGIFADGLRGTGGAPGLVVPVLYLVLLNTSAARSWFRYHTY
jgi:hypothetical protein